MREERKRNRNIVNNSPLKEQQTNNMNLDKEKLEKEYKKKMKNVKDLKPK